jgi:hypothetical protein
LAVDQCLGRLISQLEGELLYVEVGVLRATNLVAIAAEQPGVCRLIGIDSYAAYKDVLHGNYVVTEKLSQYNRSVAEQKIAESGCAERIELLIENSEVAVNRFADASIDIVFLDKNLRYEDTVQDVASWYGKVKEGGLLCGHEGWEEQILSAVRDGLQKCGQQKPVNVIGDEVWWIKRSEAALVQPT